MSNYAERVDAIKDKYGPRILKVLGNIRATLQAAGYTTDEPFDMGGDSYQWSLLVFVKGGKPGDIPDDEDVDITFEIAESEQFEGTEDGINFSINIVECGGRILGGMSPYNYTPDVWVDVNDDDAVAARFALFEQADPESILELLPASLTS